MTTRAGMVWNLRLHRWEPEGKVWDARLHRWVDPEPEPATAKALRSEEPASQRSKLINVTPTPSQGQRDGTDAPRRGPRRCPQRNRYKRVLVPRQGSRRALATSR